MEAFYTVDRTIQTSVIDIFASVRLVCHCGVSNKRGEETKSIAIFIIIHLFIWFNKQRMNWFLVGCGWVSNEHSVDIFEISWRWCCVQWSVPRFAVAIATICAECTLNEYVNNGNGSGARRTNAQQFFFVCSCNFANDLVNAVLGD